MMSSSNKVVSSMIFDRKGALITKYDLIPILTCTVQMLFCPSNQARSQDLEKGGAILKE